MKIGIITQRYEPEPASAAHPTAVARSLADRGNEVSVLTGFPSYPGNRVYDGYQMAWRMHERRDGIDLLRVADIPSHDNSALRRALCFTSFAMAASANVGWLRNVDACLVYLSPATVGLAARVLRRIAGVPYVLYVQDLWPESVTASGLLANPRFVSVAERGINGFLRGLYRNAAGVAAISPGMADILRERGVRDPEVVFNWVDEAVFRPPSSSGDANRELAGDRTWVMFAGGIGYMQGLDTALAAMALLKDSHPNLSLAVVGDGVARESLEAQAASLRLGDRVSFLGRRPMSQMSQLMAQSAAQLVSLRDLPLFRFTVPSKVQSSMAAAQPIVCAVAGDAAQIVRDAGAGFCVPPGDVTALAEAFTAVATSSSAGLKRMGDRGRSFYLENLGAEAGSSRLEAMLRRARDAS